MDLLQQLSEDASEYKAHLNTINKKLNKAIRAVKEEHRLGLAEAGEYYTQDRPHGGTADTIEFDAPTHPPAAQKQPIRAPQHHAVSRPQANKRFHLVYNPETGKISEMRPTKPFERMPAEFVNPNAKQLHDVVKHLEQMDPRLADKLVNGTVDVWIPRTALPQGHESTLAAHSASTGGMNRREMGADELAAARAAADKMTFA